MRTLQAGILSARLSVVAETDGRLQILRETIEGQLAALENNC